MGNGIEKQKSQMDQTVQAAQQGPTVHIQNGSGVEKITHALTYYGIGPCEGCGKQEGSFRHATYKYSVDERYGVTTRTPRLWCSEKCCPCCAEEERLKTNGGKRREAANV